MKKTPKIFVILSICLLCTFPDVYANGFALFHQGARAAAMADAFVARASDPSAVWYNPAGIVSLEGLQVYSGGMLNIIGSRKYYSIYRDAKLESDPITNLKPNFYISCRISDFLGIGLGVNSPFNYEIEWPKTREVEHVVYVINHMKISSLAVSPTLSVKLSDSFSLGAGISFNSYRFSAKYHYPYDIGILVGQLTNGEATEAGEVIFDLQKFKANSASYFAGVQWKPGPGLSFGAVFRRGRPLTFDSGNVTLRESETPDAYANSKLAELFPDSPEQSAVISFSTVDQIQAGVSLKISADLELEFDLSYLFWSQMETIEIDYAMNTSFSSFWSGCSDRKGTTHFKNAVTLQLGLEYRLTPSFDFRFGVFHHGTPAVISEICPAFPLSDGPGFSIGLGYHDRFLFVDAAYIYTSFSDIESSNSTLLRWGDPSQKYFFRMENQFMLNAGVRF